VIAGIQDLQAPKRGYYSGKSFAPSDGQLTVLEEFPVKYRGYYDPYTTNMNRPLDQSKELILIKNPSFVEQPLKAKVHIDGELFQDHHIISHTNTRTRDHKLLELADFNLQSRANRMLLPTKEGVKVSTTNRSIHQGRHIDLVNERLAIEMDKAVRVGGTLEWSQKQYHAQLLKIISEERASLNLVTVF